MHYLKGKITDVSALEALDEMCFPDDINYQKFELVYYLTRPKTRTFLVKEKNELVGFVMAGKFNGKEGKIITIDVHPGWRRRGIGSKLLRLAEDYLRGLDMEIIVLEVHEKNKGAQGFYSNHDYKRSGRMRGYYPDGDAVKMEKVLVKVNHGSKSS